MLGWLCTQKRWIQVTHVVQHDKDMWLACYGRLGALLKKYGVKAPATGNELSDPFPFNLMFETQIGPTGKFKG